jgi:HAE1 family hydrophobic/amphiphilic exporter-1
LQQDAIVNQLRGKFSQIQEAIVFVVIPPSIQGLGVANGFQMQLQFKGTGKLRDQLQQLEDYTQIIREDGNQTDGLTNLNTSFRANVPQLFLEVNDAQIKAYDLSLENVFNALQGYLGSVYVNDFTRDGRVYQVRLQAEAAARANTEQIKRIEVTSNSDRTRRVPLGAVLNVKKTYGPLIVNRYNLYTSAAITGEAAAHYSSGQALLGMEALADGALPKSMGYEWTGVSYQERKVGAEAYAVFGLAVLMVFLVLAGQYESWTSPTAVILVVPLGLLGAAVAVGLRGMDNNVYTQIGLVLIIALASKNAILIVEVARELRAHGNSIVEAVVEASRLRFRPILMTSFAFILGIVPLLTAHSAGAASQRALGTAVFGGMIASTLLAVFFVPVFYVVMQSLSEWLSPPPAVAKPPEPETAIKPG